MQTGRSGSSRALLAVILGLSCTIPAAGAVPEPAATGRISGRVVDAGGRPIELANVGIVGKPIGTMTDEHGRFVLAGVPAGQHQVHIQSYGLPRVLRAVLVTANETATLNVALDQKVVELPVIEVPGAKRIDTGTSENSFHVDREKLQELLVDNPLQVAALQAGVVAVGEQLSIRGGRLDETKVRINDVEAVDAQTARNANVATLAVEDLTVRTGGFDAEHGGALSGIIDISTREGADTLGGQLRWDTDRFGDPTKTFDRFDRFTLAAGGPLCLPHLTWFGTYEGTFQDTYLRSTLTKPSRTLFDFIRLGNRQSSQVNTNLKLAYHFNASHKLTLETINNRTLNTPYEHMWSRQGFVHVTYDTIESAGRDRVVPRYGGWSAARRDSADQFVNLPDHVPSVDARFSQHTAVWTDQLSSHSVWTTRLSMVDFRTLSSIARKQPWEYWIESPFFWNGNVQNGTENNPYFATHGDFPRYSRRRATTYAVKSDLASARWKQHRFKIGLEAKYNHIENLTISFPNQEFNGLPGGTRSDYVNFNPEGSTYVQDRWDFEGLVLNLGLRYDVFTPGDQIADFELRSGKRYKQQISPRLGVAYPISEKDALSFHYGWTYQTPARGVIFENRGVGANVNTRGNPDLEPETNVAYQAALQHLFSRDVSGQFSVFFRDIYGLITARRERDDFGNLINVFSNGDYASARGFEASLAKHFSHKFSADVHYTYSLATGVASDPEQALQFFNGGRLFLPISERPLNWDQRHTVSVTSTLREAGKWGMRMLWTYGSGFPVTPTFRSNRRADPKLENSRRLPSNFNLSLDADKFYRIWGQHVTLFVVARNALNSVNVADPAPNGGGFPNPFVNLAGSDDYLVYYTETGRAGGAYLKDVNGDLVADWVPVHDPRVFEEGRNVRMGLSVTF